MEKLTKSLYSNYSKGKIIEMLLKQLKNFFLITKEDTKILEDIFEKSLLRLSTCISGVNNKYFNENGKSFFTTTHSGQYLIFLYLISNECYMKYPESELKDKVYYLNKIMNGCDVFYAIELPKVFFFEHPVGSVLGRAKYGNNFFMMQGCTIGGNKDSYPVLGDNLTMYSNSKILGKTNVGKNVTIAANTYIKDTVIPDNSLIFGQSPNLIIKENYVIRTNTIFKSVK